MQIATQIQFPLICLLNSDFISRPCSEIRACFTLWHVDSYGFRRKPCNTSRDVRQLMWMCVFGKENAWVGTLKQFVDTQGPALQSCLLISNTFSWKPKRPLVKIWGISPCQTVLAQKGGSDRKHMGCKRWRGPINENMIIVFLRLNTVLVCQDKRQIQAKSIKPVFFPKWCLRTKVKSICNGTLRRSKYGILVKKTVLFHYLGLTLLKKIKTVKNDIIWFI